MDGIKNDKNDIKDDITKILKNTIQIKNAKY